MNCGRKACDEDLFCMECGMRLETEGVRIENPCAPALSCAEQTLEKKTARETAWFIVSCIGILLSFFGGIAIPVCAVGAVGALIECLKNKEEKKVSFSLIGAMTVGALGFLLSVVFLLVTLFL